MKNLAKYIRESKSDIDGKEFSLSVDTYDIKLRKLQNPDLKPYIEAVENENGEAMTREYVEKNKNNITILTSLMEFPGTSDVLRAGRNYLTSYKLGEDNEISIFDNGWDNGINTFERTLDILSGVEYHYDENDDYYKPSNQVGNLKTFNFFEYYNIVANKICDELEKIFGYAQECYLGTYGAEMYTGYDVEGGSVLMLLPMFNRFNYVVTEDTNKSPSQQNGTSRMSPYYAVLRPTTFYGSDDTHFYNTKTNRGPCEGDLRLD
jgi:hypothetical protein